MRTGDNLPEANPCLGLARGREEWSSTTTTGSQEVRIIASPYCRVAHLANMDNNL